MTSALKISVINLTHGLVSDQEVHTAIRAINRQIAEDFAPYWNITGKLRLEGTVGGDPGSGGNTEDMRGDAVIYLWDEADIPNAVGYHDANHMGYPSVSSLWIFPRSWAKTGQSPFPMKCWNCWETGRPICWSRVLTPTIRTSWSITGERCVMPCRLTFTRSTKSNSQISCCHFILRPILNPVAGTIFWANRKADTHWSPFRSTPVDTLDITIRKPEITKQKWVKGSRSPSLSRSPIGK